MDNPPASAKLPSHQQVDKGHGRVEKRTATVCHDVDWLRERHDWPGLSAFGKVVAERHLADGSESIDSRYHLLSAKPSAERFGRTVRSHWAIENGLHWVRRRGSRRLSPVSLFGRLELKRGYWTRGCSKGGTHPLDAALGVGGRSGVRLTPAAMRALARLGAEKSYARAAELFGEVAGVGATAKRAERCARQVGREIAAGEDAAAEPGEAAAETMCWSPDGTGVPVRRGEAGAGRDGGEAKTRERREGTPRRDCRGAMRARRATRGLRCARHGDGDLARAWARKLGCSGRAASAMCWTTCASAAIEWCRKMVAHLAERRDRMRYDKHLVDGLPIGSGIIEAGCKNVVGLCMKCTGVRWSVAGANPVLAPLRPTRL